LINIKIASPRIVRQTFLLYFW